jgi:shikimate dehydrogenase
MSPVAVNGDRHVLFVGVDTPRSRALAAVPHWSTCFGSPLHVRPIDVPLGAGRDVYRRIVDELTGDPHAAGAVITGHKVAMYAAAADRCTYIAPDAQRLRECTVLASRPDGMAAYATDVRSMGAEVDRIWAATAAPVVCLGAGGSAAALCLHLLRRRPAPRTIVVCERDPDRAAEFVELFTTTAAPPQGVELRVETGASTWDDVVATMPAGVLVVNATGLGKTDHCSPLSSAAVFPRHATVWDLNYRGPLSFLVRARAQAEYLALDVHDGWHLFALGWLAALGAVLDVDPPVSIEDSFVAIAQEVGR